MKCGVLHYYFANDLVVYYNFAERRAYYVVNGKSEDKFVEF